MRQRCLLSHAPACDAIEGNSDAAWCVLTACPVSRVAGIARAQKPARFSLILSWRFREIVSQLAYG